MFPTDGQTGFGRSVEGGAGGELDARPPHLGVGKPPHLRGGADSLGLRWGGNKLNLPRLEGPRLSDRGGGWGGLPVEPHQRSDLSVITPRLASLLGAAQNLQTEETHPELVSGNFLHSRGLKCQVRNHSSSEKCLVRDIFSSARIEVCQYFIIRKKRQKV